MIRSLWTELRRSTARWAGVIVLGVSLAFLYTVYGKGAMWTSSAAWTAQWTALAIWTRFLLVLTWPAAVGIGAVLGLRDRRSGMTELLSMTPRPAAHRLATTAGALGISLATGYLALIVIGGVQVVANDGMFRLTGLPIALVGAVALVAGGWFGMGVARCRPSALTPPLLTGVTFVVSMALYVAANAAAIGGTESVPNRIVLLSPAFGQLLNPWQTVAGRVSLGQLGWLLGLAGTGFLLVSATRWRARLVATLPMIVGLTIGLTLLPTDPNRTFTTDRVAAELTCADNVCLTRLHQPLLDTVKGPGRSALAKLSRLPNAPTRVEEVTTGAGGFEKPQRSASSLLINFDDLGPRDRVGAGLESALLRGAGTPTCTAFNTRGSSPSMATMHRESAARYIAGAWLADGPEPVGPYGSGSEIAALIGPAWNTLHGVPYAEQLTRVAALRTAGLTCTGDLLDILTTGGHR
jgi:hypothetical protein